MPWGLMGGGGVEDSPYQPPQGGPSFDWSQGYQAPQFGGDVAPSMPDDASGNGTSYSDMLDLNRIAEMLRSIQGPPPEQVSIPRLDVPGQLGEQQIADYRKAQEYAQKNGMAPPEAPKAAPLGGVSDRGIKAGLWADGIYQALAAITNAKRENWQRRHGGGQADLMPENSDAYETAVGLRAKGQKSQDAALAENEKRSIAEAKTNRESRQQYYERSSRIAYPFLQGAASEMFRKKSAPTGDAAMFDIFQKDPEAFAQFQDAMHPQQGRAAAPASQFYALMMQQGHSPEEALAITQRMFGHQGAAATDPRQAFIQRQFQAYTNPANFSSMTPEQAFQRATKDAEMLYPQAPAGPAPGAPQPGGTGGAPGQGPYPTAPPSNEFPYGPYDPTGGQGGGQQQPDMGESMNTPPPQLNRLAQGWKMAAERNPAKAEEMRQSFIEQYGYDPEAVLSGGF